jgi:peptidoglycan LD-endopeptidase CwlK
MPAFSKASEDKLATCDVKLQRVFREVVKHIDCTILEGHRGKEAQNAAVKAGNSTLTYPNGNHNAFPSKAVDVAPWPVKWDVENPETLKKWMFFVGFVLGVGKQMGIELVSGIDWDSDLNFGEHKLVDFPHFELKK